MIDSEMDKAGKIYWDSTERNNIKSHAFSPIKGIRGYGRRIWDSAFDEAFSGFECRGKKLLELGCGNSSYLPYFAKKYGFSIHGIDYSESGCILARQMCALNSVDSEIICADIFCPPVELFGQFDVVVSFGVLEHFTDTSSALSKFAKYLRPGGTILTVVPNMKGLTGLGQKYINSDIYDLHELIDLNRMRNAHENAGLTVVVNKYLLFMNFGVINPAINISKIKKVLFSSLKIMTGFVWVIETITCSLPANSFTSPYILCIARLSK